MNAPVVPNIKQAQATGIVCVTLDIHLWSGRKRLRKENLLAKNPELAHLPPESLATLGSIKIADPEDLAPFLKYKREAEKLLKLHGLPLLGTIGIPEAKVHLVHSGLLEIKRKFDDLARKLYQDFDARISQWRSRIDNKDWEHLITDIPTPEYVAGRLSFGSHLCRVSAPSSDEFSDVNQQFGKQMTGLKGELFAEAAEEAKTLMEKYLMGKDAHGAVRKREKITQKTLGPLKRIGAKFKSFSFLDPTVEPLAQIVDHVLALLPDEGPIEGVHQSCTRQGVRLIDVLTKVQVGRAETSLATDLPTSWSGAASAPKNAMRGPRRHSSKRARQASTNRSGRPMGSRPVLMAARSSVRRPSSGRCTAKKPRPAMRIEGRTRFQSVRQAFWRSLA